MLNMVPEGIRVKSKNGGGGSHTKQSEYMVTPVEVIAYGQHSALLYVYDSGVPILYHEFKTIPLCCQ